MERDNKQAIEERKSLAQAKSTIENQIKEKLLEKNMLLNSRKGTQKYDELFKRTRQKIFNQTVIICTTLNGSVHESISSLNIKFETVVIDESAQAVETDILLPLKYGCKRCILVGGY